MIKIELTGYIEAELYILLPVLYAVGVIIKKSESIDDKWIPFILGILGITLATVYKLGIYAPQDSKTILSVFYAGVTQGVLCAAGSVYANNILKQLKKKDNEDDNQSNNSAG